MPTRKITKHYICNIAKLRLSLKECLDKTLPLDATTGAITNHNNLFLNQNISLIHITMGGKENNDARSA